NQCFGASDQYRDGECVDPGFAWAGTALRDSRPKSTARRPKLSLRSPADTTPANTTPPINRGHGFDWEIPKRVCGPALIFTSPRFNGAWHPPAALSNSGCNQEFTIGWPYLPWWDRTFQLDE